MSITGLIEHKNGPGLYEVTVTVKALVVAPRRDDATLRVLDIQESIINNLAEIEGISGATEFSFTCTLWAEAGSTKFNEVINEGWRLR